MKRFLSRYNLKYIRSLVYMIQSSEYSTKEFFVWHRKVKDFRNVEQRKSLVKTLKARVLLGSVAFSVALVLALVLVRFSWLALVIYVIIWPYLVLYFLVFWNFAFSQIQKPIEKRIINRAKAKLALHRAIKIGIAGSFGKTTMKEILQVVLAQGFKTRATPDNKNTPLGIARFVDSLEGDEEILIFEMGEYYPGDIKKLCDLVGPNFGVITGVNEAHLEKFKTLEVATDTIFELADYLKKKENSKLYVNAESRAAKERASRYDALLYGDFGVESKDGNSHAEGAETSLAGTSFVLKNNKGDGIVVNSKLLGLHQVGPLSAVAHIGKSLGMKTEEVELGLKETKAFEHRLEPKMDNGGVTIIDDSYNGNPDGARVAIEFLAQIKNKRRFYVTPGLVEMGAKTEAVHKEIGRLLAKAGIEKVVLVRNSVTPLIEVGLKENNYAGEIIWYENAKECFDSLPRLTISNDLLLYQNDWPDNYS